MKSHARKLLTTITAMVVFLGGLVMLAQPAAAATKCKTYSSHKTCVTISDPKPSKFIVGFRDSVYNGRSYTISGSCTSTTSKSTSHSVSVSVSAETKALIFATFSASVSYDISKSMSSGYSTSASFKIPPKSTVYCTRGILKRYRAGKHVTHYYSGGAGTITKYWTTGAPNVRQWRIT